MSSRQPNFFFLLLLMLMCCGKPLPAIKSIDLSLWQQDKNACNGYRASMLEELDTQKDKLLALDEQKIISLLGRPDRNELYKRNQKFFYYSLIPSQACDTALSSNKQLTIRFNAMGLAKEVMIE